MAFDIKREFSLLPNKYFTYDQIKAELSDICWKCRRDLAPGFRAKDLFEMGVDQGLIRAGQGDEYLVNVRRSYVVSSSTVAAQQSQPMGVGGHINLSGNVVGVLNSTGRCSGRTTRQLLALPIGGWYFCISPAYTKIVASQINCPDIVFKYAVDLKDLSQFSGYQIPGFDIDHAVWETATGSYALALKTGQAFMQSCVRRYNMNSDEALKSTAPVPRSTICPCGIHRLDCDYHK